MPDVAALPPLVPEPLVRLDDLDIYREGLAKHQAGLWDDERWTAYRVRFGIYGQRQPGVQMVRIKIPGGIVPVAWLRTLAHANRAFAVGDGHVTTRQDLQIYHVPLDKTPDLLEWLYTNGITTREACGNTIRNVNSCALAGACPHERVDASRVAEGLALSWLRSPLTQNMPRKVKITVSGCDTDCGASTIHDLGFIAVERDGKPGFRVLAGGGLGATPHPAIELAAFVEETEIPVVTEALLRLHQRYSDRLNRNASRIKFIVHRFGADKFRALFDEELARLRPLPQRPWTPLAWRQPAADSAPARLPVGVVKQHDGLRAVVITPTLGNISSDQLDGLADVSERFGVKEARFTREQNIALTGVAPSSVADVVAGVRALGLEVPDTADDVPDVISCPGSTTCRIAITNSPGFAREVLEQARTDATARGISVRISGCHNSCGLHHVGDFGFHGIAKKIDTQVAPHYQLHFGGDACRHGAIALSGPIIPARHATRALELLRHGFAQHRHSGEDVRSWAERTGKDGIRDLLKPLLERTAGNETFTDWGDDKEFLGAPKVRGECAAPVLPDGPLADLANDALINLDRALFADRADQAGAFGREALAWAARRLLTRRGAAIAEDASADAVFGLAWAVWSDQPAALAHLNAALAAAGGEVGAFRETVALWLDTAQALVDAPDEAAPSLEDLENALEGL